MINLILWGASLMEMEKKNNTICAVGFWLGVASIFIGFIGIIPLVGIILCIIGMVQFDKTKNKNQWMGPIGLVLNLLFLFVGAYVNGSLPI